MTEASLKDRMARAIAAVIHSSQGSAREDSKRPVLADRRKLAEDAADAALASIRPGDTVGDGLIAIRPKVELEPSARNDNADIRLQ